MMFNEERFPFKPEFFLKNKRQDKAILKPPGHGIHKIFKREGIRFQMIAHGSCKLKIWLFIKSDVIDIEDPRPFCLNAKVDGIHGKIGRIFQAGEALLLRRNNNFAVPQGTSGGIMIKTGKP
jgi:hypothetical protein